MGKGRRNRSLRSMHWVEAKHPRDDDGKFANKGGQKWVGRVADQFSAAMGDISMGPRPGENPGRLQTSKSNGHLIDIPEFKGKSRASGGPADVSTSGARAKALAKAEASAKVAPKRESGWAGYETPPKSVRSAGGVFKPNAAGQMSAAERAAKLAEAESSERTAPKRGNAGLEALAGAAKPRRDSFELGPKSRASSAAGGRAPTFKERVSKEVGEKLGLDRSSAKDDGGKMSPTTETWDTTGKFRFTAPIKGPDGEEVSYGVRNDPLNDEYVVEPHLEGDTDRPIGFAVRRYPRTSEGRGDAHEHAANLQEQHAEDTRTEQALKEAAATGGGEVKHHFGNRTVTFVVPGNGPTGPTGKSPASRTNQAERSPNHDGGNFADDLRAEIGSQNDFAKSTSRGRSPAGAKLSMTPTGHIKSDEARAANRAERLSGEKSPEGTTRTTGHPARSAGGNVEVPTRSNSPANDANASSPAPTAPAAAPEGKSTKAYDALLSTDGPMAVQNPTMRKIVEQMEAHGWEITGQNPQHRTTSWKAPDGRTMSVQFINDKKPRITTADTYNAPTVTFKKALAHVVTPTHEEARKAVVTFPEGQKGNHSDHTLKPLKDAAREMQAAYGGSYTYGGEAPEDKVREVASDLRKAAEMNRRNADDRVKFNSEYISGSGEDDSSRLLRQRADEFEAAAAGLEKGHKDRQAYLAEKDRRAAAPLDIRPGRSAAKAPVGRSASGNKAPVSNVDAVMNARSAVAKQRAFSALSADEIVEAFQRDPGKALDAFMQKNFGKGSGRETALSEAVDNVAANLKSGHWTPDQAAEQMRQWARLHQGMQHHKYMVLAADLVDGTVAKRRGGAAPKAPAGRAASGERVTADQMSAKLGAMNTKATLNGRIDKAMGEATTDEQRAALTKLKAQHERGLLESDDVDGRIAQIKASKSAAAPAAPKLSADDRKIASLEKQVKTLEGRVGMAYDKRTSKGARIQSANESKARRQLQAARMELGQATDARDLAQKRASGALVGATYAEAVAAVRDTPGSHRTNEAAWKAGIGEKLGLPADDDEPKQNREFFEESARNVKVGDWVREPGGTGFLFQVAGIERDENGNTRMYGPGITNVAQRSADYGESVSVWRKGVSDQNRAPLRDEESDIHIMGRRMLEGYDDEDRTTAANRLRAGEMYKSGNADVARLGQALMDEEARPEVIGKALAKVAGNDPKMALIAKNLQSQAPKSRGKPAGNGPTLSAAADMSPNDIEKLSADEHAQWVKRLKAIQADGNDTEKQRAANFLRGFGVGDKVDGGLETPVIDQAGARGAGTHTPERARVGGTATWATSQPGDVVRYGGKDRTIERVNTSSGTIYFTDGSRMTKGGDAVLVSRPKAEAGRSSGETLPAAPKSSPTPEQLAGILRKQGFVTVAKDVEAGRYRKAAETLHRETTSGRMRNTSFERRNAVRGVYNDLSRMPDHSAESEQFDGMTVAKLGREWVVNDKDKDGKTVHMYGSTSKADAEDWARTAAASRVAMRAGDMEEAHRVHAERKAALTGGEGRIFRPQGSVAKVPATVAKERAAAFKARSSGGQDLTKLSDERIEHGLTMHGNQSDLGKRLQAEKNRRRDSGNLDKARTAQKEMKAEELGRTTDPKSNGAKIRALENGTITSAALYRKAAAGPSGQRTDLLVGRVSHTPDNPAGEFHISDRDGNGAGWASRTVRKGEPVYVFHSQGPEGEQRLEGWSDSLAIGADVLSNGHHQATGYGLDSTRTSGGTFERYEGKNKTVEQLDREALNREVERTRERLANPDLTPSLRQRAEKDLARLEAEQLLPAAAAAAKAEAGRSSGITDADQARIRVTTEDYAAANYGGALGLSKDDAARYVAEGHLKSLVDEHGLNDVIDEVRKVIATRPEVLQGIKDGGRAKRAARDAKAAELSTEAVNALKRGDHAGAQRAIDSGEQLHPDYRASGRHSWGDMRAVVTKKEAEQRGEPSGSVDRSSVKADSGGMTPTTRKAGPTPKGTGYAKGRELEPGMLVNAADLLPMHESQGNTTGEHPNPKGHQEWVRVGLVGNTNDPSYQSYNSNRSLTGGMYVVFDTTGKPVGRLSANTITEVNTGANEPTAALDAVRIPTKVMVEVRDRTTGKTHMEERDGFDVVHVPSEQAQKEMGMPAPKLLRAGILDPEDPNYGKGAKRPAPEHAPFGERAEGKRTREEYAEHQARRKSAYAASEPERAARRAELEAQRKAETAQQRERERVEAERLAVINREQYRRDTIKRSHDFLTESLAKTDGRIYGERGPQDWRKTTGEEVVRRDLGRDSDASIKYRAGLYGVKTRGRTRQEMTDGIVEALKAGKEPDYEIGAPKPQTPVDEAKKIEIADKRRRSAIVKNVAEIKSNIESNFTSGGRSELPFHLAYLSDAQLQQLAEALGLGNLTGHTLKLAIVEALKAGQEPDLDRAPITSLKKRR